MKNCPLVLIEWEDSRRPNPEWGYLNNLDKPSSVKCVSVGWLVGDGETKQLAPNFGDITLADNLQASGIIEIAKRAIIRITKLKEPKLTAFVKSK